MLKKRVAFGLTAAAAAIVSTAWLGLVTGCAFIPVTPDAECDGDTGCAEGQVCEDGVCVEASEEPLHKTLFTDTLGDPNYQGTQTCLTCHSDHAADLMETSHWNWNGVVDSIAGLDDQTHGKVDLINDY